MTSTAHETFGRIGIWSGALNAGRARDTAHRDSLAEAVAELDELGYGTLWLGASPAPSDAAAALAATRRITVATGILSIWDHTAQTVAERIGALTDKERERFVLGLGVSHGPIVQGYAKPYSKMVEYLDALDAAAPPVAAGRRVLAALGPKMLDLAAHRALGAHPYLVTAGHTAQARAALGSGAVLAPEVTVVLDEDAERARTTARATLARYLRLPNYTDNLLRLGFTESDLQEGGSVRLLDALFAMGDAEQVRARVQEYVDAGADHVALQVLPPAEHGDALPREQWRVLAEVFADQL
ncbi:TIGR03620 family F420-dependent LLM class oxidoreductase [Streptomyces sp. NPDC049813]|uniref:TIGR03620 family F420-dependent LLM class oxidoreductase n=1 Tax=Streptomyces sp. NPDC049813 TaxID=3365597 RepID=UPI0037BD45B9